MSSLINKIIFPAAVKHNLRQIREKTGGNVKIYPAVKADCYGHGVESLLDVIAENSDGLCVASPASAMQLRRLGYNGPVLCFFFPHVNKNERQKVVAELISADVIQTVVSAEDAEYINRVAELLRVKAEIHLKIDTGMMRSGVVADDTVALIDFINKCNGLKLAGIYTHFSSADESDLSATVCQLELFKELISKSDLPDGVILHTANSAATIRLPESHFDMVRPGLAVYGYYPGEEAEAVIDLKPSLRITAPLIQIKQVAAGAGCGYGLTYRFERDSIIGRVPVGYGDGYPRSLSNKGVVRINEQDAPVRGRVSMDQIIIDITDIPDVKVGDEVEIISNNRFASNSVENLARLADTISYEITCNIKSDRMQTSVLAR